TYSRGVCNDERVAAIGLGFARVKIRSTAHHQPWHIRDGHLASAGDRDRELRDRPWLVDHKSRRAMSASAVQQCLEISLVVRDAATEETVTGVVEDISEVFLFADI